MKAVIVTGDRRALARDWLSIVTEAIVGQASSAREIIVIHGDGTGIDQIADKACRTHGISVIPVMARWDLYGKSAGPRRNSAMLSMLSTLCDQGYGIEVLAFHDDIDGSKGTKNMVNQAIGSVFVTIYTTDSDPVKITDALR